jgi:hypothetical protein
MSHPINPQSPLNQQGPASNGPIPAPGSENTALIDAAQVTSILKIIQKVCYFLSTLYLSFMLPYNVCCSYIRHVIIDLGHVTGADNAISSGWPSRPRTRLSPTIASNYPGVVFYSERQPTSAWTACHHSCSAYSLSPSPFRTGDPGDR